MILILTLDLTPQATLQERKRDSIKAAEKLKVKQEEEEVKKAKQTGSKHGKDAMDVDAKEEEEEEGGGAAKEEEEMAKAKRSRCAARFDWAGDA